MSMSIEKPEIDFPGGEPPAGLEITDVWEGDGAVASPGDMVKVHYVGVAYSTGEEFDASWNRGDQIGRASCREREWISVGAASLKKKKIKQRKDGQSAAEYAVRPQDVRHTRRHS